MSRIRTAFRNWHDPAVSNWNRAVELWNGGELFDPEYESHYRQRMKIIDQQECALICCAWLIPNRFQEPHGNSIRHAGKLQLFSLCGARRIDK